MPKSREFRIDLSKKSTKLWIGLIVTLVLAGAGIGAYFIYLNTKKKSTAESQALVNNSIPFPESYIDMLTSSVFANYSGLQLYGSMVKTLPEFFVKKILPSYELAFNDRISATRNTLKFIITFQQTISTLQSTPSDSTLGSLYTPDELTVLNGYNSQMKGSTLVLYMFLTLLMLNFDFTRLSDMISYTAPPADTPSMELLFLSGGGISIRKQSVLDLLNPALKNLKDALQQKNIPVDYITEPLQQNTLYMPLQILMDWLAMHQVLVRVDNAPLSPLLPSTFTSSFSEIVQARFSPSELSNL